MPALSRPRALRGMRWAALAGLLLLLPSLWLGFAGDDHFLLAQLEPSPFASAPRPFDLYDLVPAEGALRARRFERGLLPWWSSEQLTLTFVRPLSSGLFALDHALFGRTAWAYHVHSLLWLVALLAAYARLLPRFLEPRQARLAFVLLCLDNTLTMPTVWLANRHALVASALGFWALEASCRYRESAQRRWYGLALLGYVAALAASETGLACLAYPAALDACDDRGLRDRLRSASLWLVPLAVYAAYYTIMHAGVRGSSAYVSPLELGRFAHALCARLPALLADLFLNVPALAWLLGGDVRTLQAGLALLGAACWICLLRSAPRALNTGPELARLKPLALGAVLSLVPVAAALPSSRQLLVSAFGTMVWLALLLLAVWDERALPSRSRLRVAVAALLAGLHLTGAPLLALSSQRRFAQAEHELVRIARSLDTLSDCVSAQRDVILLAAPDHLVGLYTPLVRWSLGLPVARSFRVLSMAPAVQYVTASDAHTLDYELDAPGFGNSELEHFWNAGQLMRGERRKRGPVEAQVVEVGPERAVTGLRVLFDRPLSDDSYCFVSFDQGAFRRQEFAPGTRLVLPKSAGPSGL